MVRGPDGKPAGELRLEEALIRHPGRPGGTIGTDGRLSRSLPAAFRVGTCGHELLLSRSSHEQTELEHSMQMSVGPIMAAHWQLVTVARLGLPRSFDATSTVTSCVIH